MIETGERLRDAGMARVVANTDEDLRDRIVAEFDRWICAHVGSLFTIEQFRTHWLIVGDAMPSPKFWGAFTRMRGVADRIESTGQYTKAASLKTHAHPVLIWRARR